MGPEDHTIRGALFWKNYRTTNTLGAGSCKRPEQVRVLKPRRHYHHSKSPSANCTAETVLAVANRSTEYPHAVCTCVQVLGGKPPRSEVWTFHSQCLEQSCPGHSMCSINSCQISLTGHRNTNCTEKLDKLKYKMNNSCSSADTIKIGRQATNKILVVQTFNKHLYAEYIKNSYKPGRKRQLNRK